MRFLLKAFQSAVLAVAGGGVRFTSVLLNGAGDALAVAVILMHNNKAARILGVERFFMGGPPIRLVGKKTVSERPYEAFFHQVRAYVVTCVPVL